MNAVAYFAMNEKNKYNGSSFDDFLKEEGIYEEVTELAQKELANLQDNDTAKFREAPPGRIHRFFQRLRHFLKQMPLP